MKSIRLIEPRTLRQCEREGIGYSVVLGIMTYSAIAWAAAWLHGWMSGGLP